MDEDFKAKLNTISDARKLQDEQYSALLRSDDDIISLVLRAHLIMEERLISRCRITPVRLSRLCPSQLRFREPPG
jgi:hypothetical protein